jgi:hypothetical protein
LTAINAAFVALRMKRIGEPELLDELPADDPQAVQSRRDLRRVNFWMGNGIIAAKAMIENSSQVPKRIVELGAGDGSFLRSAMKRTGWEGVNVTLVDRQNIVAPQTIASFRMADATVAVVAADVFDWLPGADEADVMLANLFLHHFDDSRLASLLKMISDRADLFIAIEPRRTFFADFSGQLLRLIGCNSVTRHDAVVSIRAGFAGREISELWPDRKNWMLTERNAGLFSHLFIARRIS